MSYWHERSKHPEALNPQEQEGNSSERESSSAKDDCLLLSFSLILLEYNDAIKAGDGDRLHDLYKFALLLFKANGKTKYLYAILMYLLQIECMLSAEGAHNLKWNRFFNKHGKVGRNMLCFRIMYYNLYLNIYNFPNILYPINTSCNTIILYKSNNTTSPFLSYIE